VGAARGAGASDLVEHGEVYERGAGGARMCQEGRGYGRWMEGEHCEALLVVVEVDDNVHAHAWAW